MDLSSIALWRDGFFTGVRLSLSSTAQLEENNTFTAESNVALGND